MRDVFAADVAGCGKLAGAEKASHGRVVTVETVGVDAVEERGSRYNGRTEFEATEVRKGSASSGKSSFRRAVNWFAAPTCYEPSKRICS